jgi:hypothetical protein
LRHLSSDLFLQQLDALLQFGEIADDEREFLGGLAQVVQCLSRDSGRRLTQQAEEGARLGGQQPVFHRVHPHGRLAHDAHQDVALIVQKAVEERDGRVKAMAFFDGLAQVIDGAQRMDPCADGRSGSDIEVGANAMSAVLACLAAGVFAVLEAMSRPAMIATKNMAMMPTTPPIALKNGSISACCHLRNAPQVRHPRLLFAA